MSNCYGTVAGPSNTNDADYFCIYKSQGENMELHHEVYSSPGLCDKYYVNYPRMSSRVFLLLFIMVLFPMSNAATFFYGASDGESKSATELSLFANTVSNDNLPKITNSDLYNVFTFCKLLPKLEEMGKLKPNRESMAICKKLIEMLQPMFKTKSGAESKNRSESSSILRHRRKRKSRMIFV